MKSYRLHLKLLSDTTFGRGDGVAGWLDTEIQHDAYGLPYLGGRTLRGLLNYECADILFALELQNKKQDWLEPAQRLFGKPGSTAPDVAVMRVGNTRLPDDLRREIRVVVEREELRREEVLASLTAIRRQTAIDEQSGVPQDNSLRSERVILRHTAFEAELRFREDPTDRDLALLAACVKALRRAGNGRNRGRGELVAFLRDAQDNDVTADHFSHFANEVRS